MSLESFFQTISETDQERSISPNQINFQLSAMPKTDIPNSYSNPRVAAVPREWVLPPQMPYSNMRPTHKAVRPTVVIPRNKPGYSVLANATAGQYHPGMMAGSNERYYQQIPRYGASNSPPQKDNNANVRGGQQSVSVVLKPQQPPIMSTIQENNQTTHFMVPQSGQYDPSLGNMSTLQVHPPLINNYPALSPIYTMIQNARDETPPTSSNAIINHVQAYQTPNSVPTSIATQKPAPIPQTTSLAGENSPSNSLEREIKKYNVGPVTSQPQNPPDIISVLTNPKAAQTPIATVSGTIENSIQPSVHETPPRIHAPSPIFKPSANGAFKPPPPRVKNKSQSQNVTRAATPTTVPYTVSASQSIWSSALDNKKRCSPPDKRKDTRPAGASRQLENSDNSSLEDFANDLGNTSQDSANEEEIVPQQTQEYPYDVKLKVKNSQTNPANDLV